jgi:ADP-ribose pyrophosphatase YjhB (NUDIX family)
MRWHPHVTVAAIIEQDDKFLVVKERTDGEIVYNQPAGHLEANETLLDAIVREVQEETAWQFTPEYIVGLYRMHVASKDVTYLRVCFAGSVNNHETEQALDDGIIEALWMDRTSLHEKRHALRSPLVLKCIDDYLAGQHYEIDILKDIGNV